jgi:rubrerythrin
MSMTTFKSVEEVLDFAINSEEEAEKFYSDLAAKVETPGMKEVFLSFAKEENGHKTKLMAIKSGKLDKLSASMRIVELKHADYLVDVEPSSGMSYQEALIVAMKREKAAYKLYMDLMAKVDDADLKATFEALAIEEAKHKMRFEVEYDERILVEN